LLYLFCCKCTQKKGGRNILTKKRISVLLVFAMIFTMLMGFASPAAAAGGVPPYTVFTSGFTSVTTGENRAGGTITAAERTDLSWGNDIYITVQLPEGVTFYVTPTSSNYTNYIVGTAAFDAASSSMLRVKVAPTAGPDSVQFKFNTLDFGLNIASSVSGDIRATVDVMEVQGSAVNFIESDTRTIARVAAKAVTVSAGAATLVQMGSNRPAAKITVQEGVAASLKANEDLRLEIVTSGVTFAAAPTVAYSMVTGPTPATRINDKEYKVVLTNASAIFAGKVDFSSLLNIDPTVTGDVRIRVRSASTGTAVTSTVVTVATLGTTTVELTGVANTGGKIYAGYPFDILGVTAGSARFNFKATGGNTLPAGRIVVLEFDGAEVVGFNVRTRVGTGAWSGNQAPTINFYANGTKAWFETESWGGATEMQLYDFEVAAPSGTKSGDIKVKVSGPIGATGDVVLGSVIQPFSVSADVPRLAYPGLNQAAGTIEITETARGAIVASYVYVQLPLGVTFNSKPRVRVTDGDIRLDSSTWLSESDSKLYIRVTDVSTEASTITIDRIFYDVSRAAMEGPVTVKIGGDGNWGWPREWYGEDPLATVINARIGVGVGGHTVFTIGSLTYTLDGKNFTMDVAPVIKDGRTLLPLRFAAEAAGVNSEEVIWDSVRKTVTLIRGDRVVQVTIGSTAMLINGAVVTMDVAPEIMDGRTMLPIRWIGMALRANVEWDATARTVTVIPY
jgi:trimeric autotransporter adhesin